MGKNVKSEHNRKPCKLLKKIISYFTFLFFPIGLLADTFENFETLLDTNLSTKAVLQK